MKLYKFINENRIEAFKGDFIVVNNRIYTNPKEEHIRMAGYKELVPSEMPTYDEETQYVATKYKDGDKIAVEYTVEDIPEVEEEFVEE